MSDSVLVGTNRRNEGAGRVRAVIVTDVVDGILGKCGG